MSVCNSSNKRSLNGFLETFVKPMANVVGAGGFIPTPYDKLQSKLATINKEIVDSQLQYIEQWSKNENNTDQDMLKTMMNLEANTKSYVNYNMEIINEKVTLDNIYIITLFILFLILVGFYLSDKNKPIEHAQI